MSRAAMPGKIRKRPAPDAQDDNDMMEAKKGMKAQPLYMRMAEDDFDGDDGEGDSGSEGEGSEDGSDAEQGSASGDEEDGEHAGGGPSHAYNRQHKESLYRLPTSDEMRQLKETEQLFKSNLFRMQVRPC